MGVEKQIESLEYFFQRVNFPLQPLDYETKVVLETFFGKGGFLNLCDLIFGEYAIGKRNARIDDMTWMDIGNSQPNGKVAMALFRLLSPGGSFCNLLEAVSLPSKRFSASLKTSWNGDSATDSENIYSGQSFYMPLSVLYQSSYELLSEPGETNLYNIPRSRCPPLLLIPFWYPPLVTRYESDHSQVFTSLPCAPLPFFFLRMLLYISRRAECSGLGMVCMPKSKSLKENIFSVAKRLLNMVRTPFSEEFPLYHRLLTAYIQYFLSPTFINHMSSYRTLEDAQWLTTDVTAALLLFAPSFLWMKGIRHPQSEIHRVPCRDIVSAALVFRLVPILTESFLALHRTGEEIGQVTRSRNSLLMMKEFFNDSSSLSSWDILNPDLSFYRNCLIALRQSLISFENFRDCRREHFNNVFELWLAIINSFQMFDNVSETYVIHHYEAYSFILVDVLSMILKSSFLSFIDITGAQMLSQCLEVFTRQSTQNVFSEVGSSRRTTIEAISQYFTLNWSGDDGSMRVINPFGEETVELAASVYLTIDSRIKVGDLEPSIIVSLKGSLDSLLKAFSTLDFVLEKRRPTRNDSSPQVDGNSSVSLRDSEGNDANFEKEKEYFFSGIRRSCNTANSLHLRFPRHSVSLFGGYSTPNEISFGNEFPCLLVLTAFIDLLFHKILEGFYSSWIPKCSRGHMMYLLNSTNFSCVNHPEQLALWECTLCEEVYGSCCRFNPFGRNGEKLQRNVNSNGISTMNCIECYSIIPSNSVFYVSQVSQKSLCTDCASRPFKRRSFRFLASYRFCMILALSLIVASFLYFV